jgi:hypothetical protein
MPEPTKERNPTVDNAEYWGSMWCSYMPALIHAVARSTGPILEIGVGHFSTPVLHEIATAGRRVVSVEDAPAWIKMFEHYSSAFHEIKGGSYDDILPTLTGTQWGVTFIDNSPGGERRRKDFVAFLPISDFVVVHDYHSENSLAIDPHLVGVFHKVFTEYGPPTLIASARHSV